MSDVTFDLLASGAKIAVWLGILLNVTPIMVWIERRASALMQDRPGPNRLGPLGLIQPLADAAKFMFKEAIVPAAADKTLFMLAPLLAVVPAMTTFVVIPFGPPVQIGERMVEMVVVPGESGVLLFLALASLGVYSLVLAGYASNNKYSLLGSIRASAQMISYELALTMAVVAVLLPVGSFELSAVVAYQQESLFGAIPRWNILPQIIGFMVFLIAAFAETNRLPFDLPEAESELVAGYHTEYSAMKFALFFMGEYMSMTTLSALCATLYLGGWSLPGLDVASLTLPFLPTWVAPPLIGVSILLAKVALFMFFFVWVRWTFPRFRYDQLMKLGWKVLLPLSLVNLILVAVLTLSGVL